MKIAVIGDGGWGTAAAKLLDSYGHEVTVWGPFADYIEEIRTTRKNPRYLPGIDFPESIQWTSTMADIAHADVIVMAVPSKFFKPVCEQVAPYVDKERTLVVSLTKGICPITQKRMSEVAIELLQTKRVVVLSGPSHAEEVARGIPTAVTCACEDHETAIAAQNIFNGPFFRVYTTDDVIGVEIGGIVKNVLAIAVGVSDGIGFGDNTRAALITRGLAELMRLGLKMGARAQTLSGLAGVADLIVTCTSQHSRNHSVGERLGKGQDIDTILGSMQMVAEGVKNCESIYHYAKELQVEMPLTNELYKILYLDGNIHDSIRNLFGRKERYEHWE
jgi:glycerol-3-phosphate dehydrogenase (NAD(P)+)